MAMSTAIAARPKPATTSFLLGSRSLDWLKPRPSDAVVRLRNSSLALLTLLTATSLLPVPSPSAAVLTVVLRRNTSVDASAWTLSVAEVLLMAGLALNVVQSAYALKYPRAPHPPLPMPAKALQPSPGTPAPRRLGLSPNPTPTAQQPFISSSSSFSASLSASSPGYAASPLSTPSRTLQYTLPTSPSPFNHSLASSTLSAPPSPSPSLGAAGSPLAAYRGRHVVGAGRSLDGSFLARLAQEGADTSFEGDD